LQDYSQDLKVDPERTISPELETSACDNPGNESGETGCARRRGFCRRRWGNRCHGERPTKARKVFRLLATITVFWFMWHTVKLAMFWHHFDHPVCRPLTADSSTVTLDIPLAPGIVIHSSLAAETVSIVHDEKVPAASVQFTIKADTGLLSETEPPTQLCAVRGKRGIGFTLVTPSHDTPLPVLASTTLAFPPEVDAPAIRFLSKKEWKFKSKVIINLLRWWIKREKQEGLIYTCDDGESAF